MTTPLCWCGHRTTDLSKVGYSVNPDTPTHHCPRCGAYTYMRGGRLVGRSELPGVAEAMRGNSSSSNAQMRQGMLPSIYE